MNRPTFRARICALAFVVLLSPAWLFSQANGKLQIHFIDVGQGDGAVLISPLGEVVLLDQGRAAFGRCVRNAVDYVRSIGVQRIDYMITSHYHTDHIGCTTEFVNEFSFNGGVYDRGTAPSPPNTNAYIAYEGAVRPYRRTVQLGEPIVLDAGSKDPVTLTAVSVNADGLDADENGYSVSVTVSYGGFLAEIGGDLTGEDRPPAIDLETTVSTRVGPLLDVYKVHHHGSRYSTNWTWMENTRPTVSVISVGGNGYGHPTEDAVYRIWAYGGTQYWTERGNGVAPEPYGAIVGGNIVIETEAIPAGQTFTVTHAGGIDPYRVKGNE